MDQQATPAERAEFLNLKSDPVYAEEFKSLIARAFEENKELESLSADKKTQILKSILTNQKATYIQEEVALRRIGSRPLFRWVAAAAVLLIASGTYFHFSTQSTANRQPAIIC